MEKKSSFLENVWLAGFEEKAAKPFTHLQLQKALVNIISTAAFNNVPDNSRSEWHKLHLTCCFPPSFLALPLRVISVVFSCPSLCKTLLHLHTGSAPRMRPLLFVPSPWPQLMYSQMIICQTALGRSRRMNPITMNHGVLVLSPATWVRTRFLTSLQMLSMDSAHSPHCKWDTDM